MSQTFSYPFYTIGDQYPESSTNVRFGRGYSFASKPDGPDQLIFQLDMQGFAWWVNSARVINRTINPEINAGHIQDFYEFHRMFQPFFFNHPTRGQVTVRFNKPLPRFKSIPEAVIVQNGFRGHRIESFPIELILLP